MKKLLLTLAMVLLLPVLIWAASDVTFQWDANTEGDMAGYRLYQSTVSGQYTFGAGNEAINIPVPTTNATLFNVPDGTYYWVVTAYDTDTPTANESGPSNEVTKTLDSIPPSPPTNFFIALIQKIIAWIMSIFA